MTDRFNSLTVVLERNIRDDDAEPILEAIRMIKGVANVQGNVADTRSHVAEVRAKQELTSKVLCLLSTKEEI